MAKQKPMRRKTAKRSARPVWWLPAIAFGLIVSFSAGTSLVYDWLTEPGRFPLRVIEVKGDFERLVREDIQQTIVATIDGGFFSCDMGQLREAVLAMPWVEDVSIRRGWPDRLTMVVSEQVPLARWGDDALVSAVGTVFRPADLAAFDDLVKLAGPEGSQRRVIDFFLTVRDAAAQRDLQILAVEQDQRRHWWLRFAEDLTVSLGRERIAHRLAQFLRVYPSLNTQPGRRPARIDMRYAHGFAVRWRDVPAADAATVKKEAKV